MAHLDVLGEAVRPAFRPYQRGPFTYLHAGAGAGTGEEVSSVVFKPAFISIC